MGSSWDGQLGEVWGSAEPHLPCGESLQPRMENSWRKKQSTGGSTVPMTAWWQFGEGSEYRGVRKIRFGDELNRRVKDKEALETVPRFEF